MRPEGGPSSMLAGVLVREGLDPERHTRGAHAQGKGLRGHSTSSFNRCALSSCKQG